MAGVVPAIHDFLANSEDVDARDKRGHDGANENVSGASRPDRPARGARGAPAPRSTASRSDGLRGA
ncbi:MAG: hypothetical protein E6G97_02300 [Alphaproteobacteria bacterium]|nr:MAG: hypothetical protein E6G97_02300 [Alphaproteobacteria bacterium]